MALGNYSETSIILYLPETNSTKVVYLYMEMIHDISKGYTDKTSGRGGHELNQTGAGFE